MEKQAERPPHGSPAAEARKAAQALSPANGNPHLSSSHKAVYAALAGNLAVAATKLIAAALTGSSAMFSEGLHSAVDTANELLLLLGLRRSALPPDEAHPFGHGQELYFWVLLVSLLIFTAGGAVSVYEGILRLSRPGPPEPSAWNYGILGLAAIFDGASLRVGFQQLRETFPGKSLFQVVRSSKDPTISMVVLEDLADLAGLAIAFFGILLSEHFGTSAFDAIASMLIGAVLMAIAVLLVRETKGLLTGEAADPEMQRSIRAILESDRDVASVNPPLTMYFGPRTVLLAAEIQFRAGLNADAVADAVDRLERAVQSRYPEVKRIFIEAESIRCART